MKVYRDELTRLEIDKQELTNAEKLFNLPITSYPELFVIQKEMKNLEKLYQVYEQQTKAREQWSETLWRDLDVQLLIDGIENYIKELKKMPREVKAMPLSKLIELTMKEFRESLPLMLDLKNEALRERHWRLLMKETNIEFDMNPESFTLENLFQMNLQRFNEVIQSIVTSATKELQIEKVNEQWRSQETDRSLSFFRVFEKWSMFGIRWSSMWTNTSKAVKIVALS